MRCVQSGNPGVPLNLQLVLFKVIEYYQQHNDYRRVDFILTAKFSDQLASHTKPTSCIKWVTHNLERMNQKIMRVELRVFEQQRGMKKRWIARRTEATEQGDRERLR